MNHGRFLRFAAVAVALAGVAGLVGCGKDPVAPVRRTLIEDDVSVPVLAGVDGPLAVYVAPIGFEPRPASWYSLRLRDLAAVAEPLSFFELAVYHLGGPGAPPVRLDEARLWIERGDDRFEYVPDWYTPSDDRVRASTLRFKTLGTFAGTSLGPGDIVEALFAVRGSVDAESATGGRLEWAGHTFELTPRHIPLALLDRLRQAPTREIVVASLAPPDRDEEAGDPVAGDEDSDEDSMDR